MSNKYENLGIETIYVPILKTFIEETKDLIQTKIKLCLKSRKVYKKDYCHITREIESLLFNYLKSFYIYTPIKRRHITEETSNLSCPIFIKGYIRNKFLYYQAVNIPISIENFYIDILLPLKENINRFFILINY